MSPTQYMCGCARYPGALSWQILPQPTMPRRTRSMRSAAGACRGALDQLLRSGLEEGEEAGHRHPHAHPRVALDVARVDQRAGHAARLDDLLDRSVDRLLHLGLARVSDVAHGRRQVAGRHEEDVDVVDLDDLGEVADGDDVLDQGDQQALVVGGREVVAHAEALTAGEHAALPAWRELGGLDDGFGLGTGVDVRHDDALGAAIERTVDRGVVVVHHADDRGHPPEVAGAGEVSEVGVVDTAVLAFQPDTIYAQRAELIDQVRFVGAGQDRRDLAGGQLLLHAIRSNVHVVSFTCRPDITCGNRGDSSCRAPRAPVVPSAMPPRTRSTATASERVTASPSHSVAITMLSTGVASRPSDVVMAGRSRLATAVAQ